MGKQRWGCFVYAPVSNTRKKGWNLQGRNLDSRLTEQTLRTYWVLKALVYVILIRTLLDRDSCPSCYALGDLGTEMKITQLLKWQSHYLNPGLSDVHVS